MTSGIDRNLRQIDGLHFKRDPKHGKAILDVLVGHFQALQRSYPDDPALAAEDILEAIPGIRGNLRLIESWAQDVAHQSLAPTPETGAQI